MRPLFSTLLIFAILSASCGGASPSRLSRIRQRGVLVCGVSPGIAGFDEVDGQGTYKGFDIDQCRAVAAAILGSAAHIRYQPIESIDVFERSADIDIVSRRLTWTLQREGLHVLFGPITFYDGQGFLVPARVHADRAADLAGVPICVQAGSEHDVTLTGYFRQHQIPLSKVGVADGAAGGSALTRFWSQSEVGRKPRLPLVKSTLDCRPDDATRTNESAGAA